MIRQQVCELWLECFPEDSPADAKRFLDEVFCPENMIASYEENPAIEQRLVAMLHIIPFERMAYIYGVATHPDFRRQGRASALIRSAIEKCREKGFDAVLIIPETEALRKWYASFGFEGEYPVSFNAQYDFGTGDSSKDIAAILPLRKDYSPTASLTLSRSSMTFRDITHENWPVVAEFFKQEKRAFGDFTAAYSWPLQGVEHFQYALYNGCMIWREGTDAVPSFSLPFGTGDKTAAIEELRRYCKSNCIRLVWGPVSREQLENLKSNNPEKIYIPAFLPEFWPDYIYERNSLASMAGTHLSGKRWFVHKFEQLGTYSYEPLNIPDALTLLDEWLDEKRNSAEDDSYNLDYNACRNFLTRGSDQIKGGILYLNGKPVGFNTGEPISPDTIVLTCQKALRDVKGAFAKLVQEFALHDAEGFRYINLSDTQGENGLHLAKMEYHPLSRQPKWAVFELERELFFSKEETSRPATREDAMFLAHCILVSHGEYDFSMPSDKAEEMTSLCRSDDSEYSYRNAKIICIDSIPVGCVAGCDDCRKISVSPL